MTDEEAGRVRDFVGYGRHPPDPKWPGRARVAVQFVVNFEEGGENNILHGDEGSEAFLSDVLGARSWAGRRHPNVESMFEYGSRAGFWRLWRGFVARDIKSPVRFAWKYASGCSCSLAKNALRMSYSMRREIPMRTRRLTNRSEPATTAIPRISDP